MLFLENETIGVIYMKLTLDQSSRTRNIFTIQVGTFVLIRKIWYPGLESLYLILDKKEGWQYLY